MNGSIVAILIGGAVIVAGSQLKKFASKEKDRAALILSFVLVAIGSVAIKTTFQREEDLQTGKLVRMTCLSKPGGMQEQRPLYICLGNAPANGDPFQAPYADLVAKAVRPQPVAKTPAGRNLYIDG